MLRLRITRFRSPLAALLAFALVAASCGGADNETTDEGPADEEPAEAAATTGGETSAEAAPKAGGTLRVAVEAESDGLNPAANSFAASAYVMAMSVVEPLVYWDAHGESTPYLAESFAKIGDGSSWQMKLREGVRFHDGTELDADDVIATFEAQFNDPIISKGLRPTFTAASPIEKIDAHTVQYNMKNPYARFPGILVNQLGMVVPSEWLARADEDSTLDQMPIGTGPFKIESRIQDQVTVLVRNPDYWGADTVDVNLDRVEIYPVTDAVTAAERLAAGELDIVLTTHPEAILTMRDTEGVRTVEDLSSAEDFAILNTQRAPFDDIRARQALTFAAPRNAYLELIGQGVAEPAHTMFHPDLPLHNPDVVQETDMPERAGPLVAAYCADHPGNCTDGRIDMELQHSGPSITQTRIADLLVDGWKDYFNVTRDELLQDTHIQQVAFGQFDAITWRQFSEVNPDVDVIWMQCEAIGPISLNWPRYCDERRDELLLGQLPVDDAERRAEMWREVQQITRDAYTYIFFAHANWTIGARDNVGRICGQTAPVTGVELLCNHQGIILMHEIWLD